MRRLHTHDRVLLVGNTRQHESVEPGRIFAQLQGAGMKTVKQDEIARQRDPELKQVVEQLARGEVGKAVRGLERQGRIHEVSGHEGRIAAIAKEYARSPANTLVVSPDNHFPAEINQAIRARCRPRALSAEKSKESFETSNWKLFHDALKAHQAEVLDSLLPKYSLPNSPEALNNLAQ